MKTVAYLRVSTAQQDVRSQRLAILEYARQHDFSIDDFIEATASGQASEKRRRLDELMSVLEHGDRLVVSELSRLGRSLGQIVAILDALAKARASGQKLGRPKGSLGVSRLDGKEDEIRHFLELGVSKTSIAQDHGRLPLDPLQLHEHPRAQDAPLSVYFCTNLVSTLVG